MIDPHAYNITIRKGHFDDDVFFEARVKELPDLTEYADSYDEAYQLVIDAIETTVEAFQEKARDMPAPHIPADDFSGRVTLRLPKSLHRAMVEASEDEGISLNQYMVNVLSYFSGYADGGASGVDHSMWSFIARPEKPESYRKPKLKVVYSNDLDQQSGSWKQTG
ncbi:MAG TPA: toxin-antitoxin system HicB family antitoxin [Gammaproteobacteria bacterium]|nr:toxin-antitoxin system HicB family antitoxin [Gammaproteobacteria bacterium]